MIILLYLLIYCPNKRINIILYPLVLFVSKYLHINQPKLASKELDIPKVIKKSSLNSSII